MSKFQEQDVSVEAVDIEAQQRDQSQPARRTSIRDAVSRVVHTIDPLASPPDANRLGLGIDEIKRVHTLDATPVNGRHGILSPIPSQESLTCRLHPELPVDAYSIQRLAKHDDIDMMPRWKRLLYRSTPLFVLATFGAHWLYFALRVIFTIAAQRAGHKTLYMAWTFVTVEAIISIPMILHRVWNLHATGTRHRPKLRLIGDNVPSVDVVITCCKEDDDLIYDTAAAACTIDYPVDRFRVIVCDDGRSTSLERLINDSPFTNLYYRSREKTKDHHFKAGNLNYALSETEKMGGAHFLAALDADMIPERDWLRALLPHMLQDPKCCMACPPQLFYNVPEDDPLCQSLDTFVHNIEPIKDALGVAWCTGSGYILRRAALQEIGGFPTGSLAEDVCCSSMLLGAGWRTAFVHEPLQYGTVPDSLTSHLKQRTRWVSFSVPAFGITNRLQTIGTVQTSIKLRFCLWGPLVKHMTFLQRLCGFIYTISSVFTVFYVMSILTIPIVLVSGGNLVPYTTINQLRWLIRSCWLALILNRISELFSFLPAGYRSGQRENRAMIWMAPFHAFSILRTFFLPGFLGGKVAVFTSSGSQKAELNERDKALRAPLWRRLKVTIWDCQCYFHLIYISFVVSSIIISTYWIVNNRDGWYGDRKTLLLGLLTHIGWPPVLWLICVVSCWQPINYALFPPNVPHREDLLERDPKTGVAHPTESAKSQKNGWAATFLEVQYSLITLYTTAIFVMSFFI